MTRIKRPVAAAGAAVLLAFSLTACGGAPTDADEDEFCGAFADAFEPFVNLSADEDPSEEQWEEFQDAVGEMEDVGTPEDISDDEREGFEVFVEAVGDADYDDVKDAGDDEFPGVDADDEDKVTEFLAYGGDKCAEELGIPTDIPTDLTDIPTDLTDIPTDLTEIPTDLTEIPTELTTEFTTE